MTNVYVESPNLQLLKISEYKKFNIENINKFFKFYLCNFKTNISDT